MSSISESSFINCRSCRSDNPEGNFFCGRCGAPLAGMAAPSVVLGATTEREGGERRHIVLLFADVASSTEIARRLDPEEWRELLADYQDVVTRAVVSFGGFVARYVGDGALAYFGWPMAHENDSERAALAGRAILDGMAEVNRAAAERGTVELGVRIGIHQGEVVVGPSGEVYGDAPNVAARVQSMAAVNTVVVTEHVLGSITPGRISAESLGEHPLKGVESSIRLHRILSPNPNERPGLAASASTPFVGRRQELRTLLERWELAQAGKGQIVTLSSEAGLGKSRLVQEFHRRIWETPHLWFATAGSELSSNTPLQPVVRLLDRVVAGLAPNPATSRRTRLERLLTAVGMDAAVSAPQIADLLGMAPKPQDAPDAGIWRALQLRTLATWLLQASRRRPLVLVVEDMHWIDPSTLELVEAIMKRIADAPLLMIHTTRPEFRAPWPILSRHTYLTLNRLARNDIRAIVQGVVVGARDDVVEAIVERTSGVPLFAEELARLVKIRAGELGGSEIPGTLAASLNARLDRLGPAREIAQIAAVMGDEFSADVLGAVTARSPGELRPLLDRLISADILSAQPAPRGQIFAFKHALIRDAAYKSLLRGRRRGLHERVADVIIDSFPTMAESQPEIVARHLSAADQHGRAAPTWHAASMAAVARGAFREAELVGRQALSSVLAMPPSRDRDYLHLKLQNALVPVLQVTQGYSAALTAEAAELARELAERLDNVDELTAQAQGQWAALSSAGKYIAAAGVGDRLLALARRAGRRDDLAHAHMVQMTSRYRLGDLVGAERYFEEGRPLFMEQGFIRRPGAIAQTFGNASRNVWMMGRVDEAQRRMDFALAMAGESGNPLDMAFARYMAAILAVLMRKAAEARRLAEESIEISDKHNFPQFAAISRVALGRALADLGDPAGGARMIDDGIAGMSKTQTRVAMTMYLAWLAECRAATGATAAALASIERAFAVNREELFFRAELLRIRGDLRSTMGDTAAAEKDIRQALAVAGDMSARWLQLRAAVSLHCALTRAGNSGARDEVRKIFSGLGEGRNTPDARAAALIIV